MRFVDSSEAAPIPGHNGVIGSDHESGDLVLPLSLEKAKDAAPRVYGQVKGGHPATW